MKGHPGGDEHTLRMLELAGIKTGRVLDMGAGDGGSLRLMHSLGIDAVGIDLEPRGDEVQRGDMLCTDFTSESFDGINSQCSFFVSGDIPGALRESSRVLKRGGMLMLSDVCFENIEPLIVAAGYEICFSEDMTAQWREYYFERLWSGDMDCCGIKGKCSYMLYICRKV